MADDFRDSLNWYAAKYAAAGDMAEKRDALVKYLQVLSILAAPAREHVWSMTLSTCGPLRNMAPPPDMFIFDFKPILDLEEALLQLNNREEPELFRRSKTSGKPLPRKDMYWRAIGSALVTVLMQKFKKSERQASEKVIKTFKKFGRPLVGKTSTSTPAWKLLQTWRDKCINGEKGELARYCYDIVLHVGRRAGNEDQFIESVISQSNHFGSYLPDDPRPMRAFLEVADKIDPAKHGDLLMKLAAFFRSLPRTP